jgi:lysozyme family protein
MSDFRLETLKPRYEQLFASALIRSSWLDRINQTVETMMRLRSPYYDVIEAQTTVPWWFTGILHYRQSNFGEVHLHNGDPLTNRTIREPMGRPQAPPANGLLYTFIESAIDALRGKDFHTAQDRSIAAWLWRFELWNGWGYAMRGINSEYLWNGTNHFGSGQNRGTYVADQIFDPNAESHQIGAAALLWFLYHKGIIDTRMEGNSQPPVATNVHANFTPAPSPGAVPFQPNPVGQSAIQLVDACQDYRQLAAQDAAIAWLQQQQPASVLAEFALRWGTNPNPVMASTAPTVSTVSTPPSPIPVSTPPTATTTETQSIEPEPPSKSLNEAILEATLSLRGMDTSKGPDRGRNACAWTFNHVLRKAGIPELGSNPNLVKSLVDDLNNGRGQKVSKSEAKAGDIVIAPRFAHVGVGLTDGCRRVLSNSSSRAKFVWESGIDFDGSYGGSSTIYRLLK